MMKNILIFIAIVVFSTSLFAQSDSDAVIMSSIPNAEIKTLDGEIVNTSDVFEDSVPVLILFWATWCKPCFKELDAFNEVYDDWKEEIDFRIVAISIDDARSANDVKPRVMSKGWEFDFYLDVNQDFKKLMNVNIPPHSFIVNKNGEVVYQHISYSEGDEEEIYEELKKYQ